MPATYTPLLRLTKPGLGDTGWGTTANDGITELVDTSVAGTVSVDVTSGNVTLSTANGATDQARHMFIRVFGASVARDVLVPATSKLYFVVNDCTAAVTVKVSGQTGVAIPAGTTAVVRCNGTDVVTSLSYAPALTLGAALAAASGGTGQASYTTGDLLYATGATALSKLGIGTNGQILTSTGTAPQWSTLSGVAVTTFSAGTTGFTPNSATSGAVTLAGTLATTNGGTGLTSFTANGVVYASSTSALATGSALTFDGTNFTTTGYAAGNGLRSLGGNAVRFYNATNANWSQISAPAGTGDMQFDTGAGEQMRLTSTGLGIGTSNPSAPLMVLKGAAGADVAYLLNAGGYGLRFQAQTGGSGTNSMLYVASGETLSFGVNNSEQMRLDSSGNLGIGTSSPGAKLEVYSATNAEIRVNTASDGYLQLGQFTNGAYIGPSSTDAVDGVLRFGTGGTERARIDSSGNLLVGGTTQLYGAAGRGLIQVSGSSQALLGFGTTGNVGLGFLYHTGTNFELTNAQNGYLSFGTNNTERMRLDSSGNLGLGATPSAWGIGFKAIEGVYGQAFAYDLNVPTTRVVANAFNDGSWKYKISSFGAGRYDCASGAHQWYTAPSGTAGNTISFTQAMTLDASGNLSVAATSPVYAAANRGNITVGGSASSLLFLGTGTATGTYISHTQATGIAEIWNGANAPMLFATNNTERARITSGGNFVLGNGETAASPTSSTLQATGGSGTNITGAALTIQGGRGTGSAEGGPIVFSTSAAGSSGTTLNTADERARISPAGNLLVGVQSDAYKITAWSSSGDNGLCIQNPTTGIGSGNGFLVGLTAATDAMLWSFESNALIFATNNTERARITSTGNVVAGGSVALATNATDGFLYVPTCAGTPTGTPTAITGMAPIVVNTTNNKLYFYSGGQWRDAGP